MDIHWRTIDPVPSAHEKVIPEKQLQEQTDQLVLDQSKGTTPNFVKAQYAYYEEDYEEVQKTLRLQYVIRYSADSPIFTEAIPATE